MDSKSTDAVHLDHPDANEEERLKSLGKNIYGMRIYESLYRESTIKLPGSAFHNQHLNFYLEYVTEPIFFPSTLFMFDKMKNMQGMQR